MRTIIHVSDIHFGKADLESIWALIPVFKKFTPHLVVVSGDLTQRARIKEYESARMFMDKLKKAQLQSFVIPGNHDIRPFYKPIKRIANPYEMYRKYISEVLDPIFVDEEIAVVAINTVRPTAIQNGRATLANLEKASAQFKTVSDHLVKIIVTHHPFDLPIRYQRIRLARKARAVIYHLAREKVDMYLSGHYHQSSSVHTLERYKEKHYSAIAVQAGTVSLRQRKETQSFNVIQIKKPAITVDTYLWNKEKKIFYLYSSKKFNLRKEHGWQSQD